jgi:hypothetical protein
MMIHSLVSSAEYRFRYAQGEMPVPPPMLSVSTSRSEDGVRVTSPVSAMSESSSMGQFNPSHYNFAQDSMSPATTSSLLSATDMAPSQLPTPTYEYFNPLGQPFEMAPAPIHGAVDMSKFPAPSPADIMNGMPPMGLGEPMVVGSQGLDKSAEVPGGEVGFNPYGFLNTYDFDAGQMPYGGEPQYLHYPDPVSPEQEYYLPPPPPQEL